MVDGQQNTHLRCFVNPCIDLKFTMWDDLEVKVKNIIIGSLILVWTIFTGLLYFVIPSYYCGDCQGTYNFLHPLGYVPGESKMVVCSMFCGGPGVHPSHGFYLAFDILVIGVVIYTAFLIKKAASKK